MKFSEPIAIQKIAEKYQCEIIGDASLMATGINEIRKVETGDITFVDVEKYFKKSIQSAASIIILNRRTECPPGKALLLCEQPFEVYNQIVKTHRPFEPLSATISDTAVIHPSTILEPNVVVGHHVRIGKNCYIQANVTIAEYTVIGDHVTIQSGAIIGTDAFYYKRTEAGYKKWRSGGRVVIEDHVEIGAACTINKGVSGDTIIGAGTKLDCQVHIGHGVVVGKNCLFAAQVGIGGKSIIEDNVVLYGKVGVVQDVRLGKNAVVLAGAGVSKSLPGDAVYYGPPPAAEARQRYKELAVLRQLPELIKKLR